MLEQIREIIAENLAIDVEKVTESADFKEDLDADSLDLFEMVTALEDEYEIEIPGRRPSNTQNSRRRSEVCGKSPEIVEPTF